MEVKKERKTTKPKTTTPKAKKVETPVVDNSVIEMLMKQIADLQAQIQTKNEDVVITKEDKPKKKSLFKDIKDITDVEVKRIIGGTGSVFYIDKKNGDEYLWAEKDSIEYMDASLLRKMKTSSPIFLTAPWLRIINNDEVVEALGLTELYKNIDLIEDIDMLSKMSEEKIKELSESLTNEYKNVLSTNVLSKVVQGDYTVALVKKFERALGKDFSSF